MAFKHRQGGNKGSSKSKTTTGGNDKISKRKNIKGKIDKKTKAAAPTADELDNELMKYMGNEHVAKTLDGELDEYFKSGETV